MSTLSLSSAFALLLRRDTIEIGPLEFSAIGSDGLPVPKLGPDRLSQLVQHLPEGVGRLASEIFLLDDALHAWHIEEPGQRRRLELLDAVGGPLVLDSEEEFCIEHPGRGFEHLPGEVVHGPSLGCLGHR